MLNENGWAKDYSSGRLVKMNGDAVEKGVIDTPGILCDGDGHYWDAHGLPEGLGWDRTSKCPDVEDGYVMAPDGSVWDEKAVGSVDFGDWAYDEDGVFTNGATGESWKYDKDVAEVRAAREADRARESGKTGPWPGMAEPSFGSEPSFRVIGQGGPDPTRITIQAPPLEGFGLDGATPAVGPKWLGTAPYGPDGKGAGDWRGFAPQRTGVAVPEGRSGTAWRLGRDGIESVPSRQRQAEDGSLSL